MYNREYYTNYDVGIGKVDYKDSEYTKGFLQIVAARIHEDLHPQTVLDAGCAMGHLVAAMKDLGVDAYGVDISEYAISQVREDIRDRCFQASLTDPFPAEIPSKVDLVVTFEVLEHLDQVDGEKAIRNICSITDTVVFCSSPDDYIEPTHVNVQQREYWARLFAQNGFYDDLSYRPIYIVPYAVVYRRQKNWLQQVELYERFVRLADDQRTEMEGALQNAAQLQEQIKEKEETLQRLNADLMEMRTSLEGKAAQLAGALEQCDLWKSQHDKQVREKEEILRQSSAEIASLQKESEEKAAKLADALEQCDLWKAQHDKRVKEKEEILRQSNAEIASLQNESKEKAAQLAEALVQRDLWKSLHECILNTRSWRYTAPMRCAVNRLKKLKKKCGSMAAMLKKGVKSLRQNGISDTLNRVKKRVPRKAEALDVQKMKTQRETVFERMVKFSILVPLYNTPQEYLRAMIQSVIDQTYANWELCLADGSDAEHAEVGVICREYQSRDGRIVYRRLEKNMGIAENTNQCATMATGEYFVLLDHDDLLTVDALYENARAINACQADILYSDEDHLSLAGNYINPFFKPDWSPDLLYSQMYICHLFVFRAELFRRIGGFCSEYNGAQDYDLMLRLSEHTDAIHHIPKILYHWRESENSTAMNADSKPYAHDAGRKALDAHLKRKYQGKAYAEDGSYLFTYVPRFCMEGEPQVSIIIPMKDKWELTQACIESILEKTHYPNYEILILDNRSELVQTQQWLNQAASRDARIRVLKADMEFNWSKINNFGIRNAHGDVFVFLNNDTVVISPEWLERLAENALRDEIGAVGPLLLYGDGTIQHAGVVVGFGGWADHVFKGMKAEHNASMFVSPVIRRNVLAVTGACMAVSRKTIEKIGGFDETFVICGSDCELCIRAHERGLFNLYDASVRLYHLESKSRDSFIPEIDFKRSYDCYTPYRENGDPFYNCNLDMNSTTPREKS